MSQPNDESEFVRTYGINNEIFVWFVALVQGVWQTGSRRRLHLPTEWIKAFLLYCRKGTTNWRINEAISCRTSGKFRSQLIDKVFPAAFRRVVSDNASLWVDGLIYLDGTHSLWHPPAYEGSVKLSLAKKNPNRMDQRVGMADVGCYGRSYKLHKVAVNIQVITHVTGTILWVEALPGNCDDVTSFWETKLPDLIIANDARPWCDDGYKSIPPDFVRSTGHVTVRDRDDSALVAMRGKIERLNQVLRVWGAWSKSGLSLDRLRKLLFILAALENEKRSHHPLSWWDALF
eukprot:TRINITY_DN67784_c3_g6_i1.p1 TRINITY_DN67784_c3_g6~~TRINITY_DN67784_c3_g6_i1.p1  ORF type:complete len:289 (+),score=22.92 TRINITY_DN67784_c3_g6_i1:44-910(+)